MTHTKRAMVVALIGGVLASGSALSAASAPSRPRLSSSHQVSARVASALAPRGCRIATKGSRGMFCTAKSPALVGGRDRTAWTPGMIGKRKLTAKSPVLVGKRKLTAKSPVLVGKRKLTAKSPVLVGKRKLTAKSPVPAGGGHGKVAGCPRLNSG
jgi:hypothetical protein